MIASYRDLKVWQVSMDLVEQVYLATRDFPSEERYGLTSQARRAAVSVPANIAEGRARTHLGVYLHHLAVAQGSLAELETHLDLARRLGFLKEDATTQLFLVTGKLGRMLHTLVRRLREGTRTSNAIGSTRRMRTHPGAQPPIPDTRDPTPPSRPA